MIIEPKIVETVRATSVSLGTIGLVIVAAGLSSTGNLIIKGALKAGGGLNMATDQLLRTLFHLFTNPGIILGLALYLVGFVIWAKALSEVDISTVYPIFISLAFIVVVLGSRLFFGESLGVTKLGGIAIIVIGIVLASRG